MSTKRLLSRAFFKRFMKASLISEDSPAFTPEKAKSATGKRGVAGFIISITAAIFLFLLTAVPVQVHGGGACCGFDLKDASAVNGLTKESCEKVIKCILATNSFYCQNEHTELVSKKYYDSECNNGTDAAKCNAFADTLKESACKIETNGLLRNLAPGCVSSGDCTICDMVKVFSNGARFVLGLAGGIALLMFILGGLFMIIAQGSAGLIEKGKAILKNTLIALVIVLAAWQIIRVVVFVLVPTRDKGIGSMIVKVFADPNYNPCAEKDFGKN